MNTDTSKEASQEGDDVAAETEQSAPGLNGEGAEKTAELLSKLQESEKKYVYLFSEFENFRRRVERDRIEFLKFGHESFLRDLLQVMDNFERALAHAQSCKTDKESALNQVCQGIEMIHYQMLEALRTQGVSPIKSEGTKFDPTRHEAVGEEESEAEVGTIVRELQKGYLLHTRLLRPARVIVAKKKV